MWIRWSQLTEEGARRISQRASCWHHLTSHGARWCTAGDKVRETCVELVHEAFRGTHEGQAGFPFSDIDLTCTMCVQITTYRRWRASSRPCRRTHSRSNRLSSEVCILEPRRYGLRTPLLAPTSFLGRLRQRYRLTLSWRSSKPRKPTNPFGLTRHRSPNWEYCAAWRSRSRRAPRTSIWRFHVRDAREVLKEMVADGEGSLGDVLSGYNRVRPNSVVDEQRGCEPFRWRLRLGGSPSWKI